MAPPCSSVTSVVRDARANNPSHRPLATPSPPSVANVSAHDDIDHHQSALSEVPSPAPPPLKPSVATSALKPSVATSAPPLRQSPGQRRPHVVPGVIRVPIQINEAAAIESIQKMTINTWSLVDKWPLGSLFGLLGRGKEPQPGETALPAKVVSDTAEEERSKDESPPPPPYSLG